MPAAARGGDMIKQDAPHCHMLHPATPPVPVPHPGLPLPINPGTCVPTVLIANMPAAVVGSSSAPCMMVPCAPGGPGVIAKGSVSVMIGGRPAARLNDPTAHMSCVAPSPSPVGKVMGPGALTVEIGG